jgi:shikimate kinase
VSARVVIVGPPGAGKTTVGQLLAARLGLPFRDTDADIEAVAGKSVADIFIDDGEAAFRALERSAVRVALDEHDGVLALGGGAVLDPGSRELLSAHRVVFLDVGLADAAERVGFNRSRPLLVLNPRGELHRLLAERRPFYESVATAVVVTDGHSPDEVVEAVVAVLGPA